jgi:hypothetical protein
MSKTVSGFVDYALRRLDDDHGPKEETRQMTYRAPARLVSKLDAVALFLGVTRTAFMTEALELAAEEAIDSIEGNLIFAKLKVNGLTIREFIEADERGENPRNAFAVPQDETNVRVLK